MGLERRTRSPDGREWVVARKLAWPRWRQPDMPDWYGGLFDIGWDFGDSATLVGVVLLVVIVIPFVIVWLLPLLFFVAEGALAVVGVLFVLRPWRVVAETAGPPEERLEFRIRGWDSSRRAITRVARGLAAGAGQSEIGETLGRGVSARRRRDRP